MVIKFLYVISAFSALSYSCRNSRGSSPEDVIKRYERLVLEMKADSISQLFTSDAEVGHEDQPVIKGRDSIYSLLSSFKNVKVISNRDQVTSSTVKNDSAIVNGDYTQTVIVSGKDTVNVAGKFTATMIRDKNGWFIAKMKTRSR